MSSSHRIARSTGVLTLTTGASRVLGFIRDMIVAGLFGTGTQAQAFVIAFRIPNLLRDLVAEGAVSSAVVPVLSWYRAKADPKEFWKLSQALCVRLGLFVILLGCAGVFAAEPLVRLTAPGFSADPEKFHLTVRLTRLLFPFITLVGLWAYFMGLLNSLHHFAVPALGPAILNVAIIAACVWVVPRTQPGVVGLAVGVIIGGVIQLAVQIPVAVWYGFRWRWRWRHPGSKQILALLGPRMVGSAVYQASVLVDTVLASLVTVVGEGAVAALYFSNRVVQLPMGIFGTAAAQASLPSLAEQAAHEEWDAFARTLRSVLRMVGFVILPSSVGLIALALPIVAGLFQHGAFDHRSSVMTARAMACYALGLLAYSSNKIFTSAFYALRDTRTPVRLAAEAMVANAVLSVALMWPFGLSGIALGTSASSTINACRLARRLERRLGRPVLAPLRAPLGRITAASLLMGAGCWVVSRWVVAAWSPWVGLPVLIGAGLMLYAASCRLLQVQELHTVVRWLARLPFTSE